MAIQPQIALDAGANAVKPIDPLATMATLENAAALRENRLAQAQTRQEQAKALIEKAQDNAAMDAALKQSGGDLLGASDILTSAGNGRLGQAAKDQHIAQTQKMAAAMKSQHDVAQAHLDTALQIASTMGDSPEHYASGRQAMAGLLGDDPTLKQWFDQYVPQQPDPAQIPQIVDGIVKVGNEAKTNAANQQKDLDDFQSGKTITSTVSRLLATPAAGRQAVLTTAAQMSQSTQARDALVQTLAPILGDDDALKKAGTTPHEQALEANTAADNARLAASAAETARHNRAMEARPVGGAAAGAQTTEPKDIASAIIRGEQPPVLTGMYRDAAPIRAELARQGYPLAKATEDWTATQKYLATLNGQQQTRLRQAIDFTGSSLDLVEDLSKQWDAGGFPILNAAQLSLAKNGALGPKAQAIATKMSAQIADLTSELGTVYKGGNSSTDESLKLAAKNLSENWSNATLLANVDQIRKNLVIRKNSMSAGAGAAGVNPGNPYVPPSSPLDVTDPSGKVHHFDTPAQAQTFRDLLKKSGGGE